MIPYHATESNRFCSSISTTVSAGESSKAIYLNAVQPYRLDCVSGKFASSASGSLTITVVKNKNRISVFSHTFDGNSDFIVSDIGTWLSVNANNTRNDIDPGDPYTDIVLIDNQTDQDLSVVLDFVY